MRSTLTNRNSAAVIPCFNEIKYIRNVVLSTLKYVDYVILVDDGSTDNSVSVLPTDDRIIVLRNEQNFGKGHSLNAGFMKVQEMGIHKVITLDGDAQHDPALIPQFLSWLDKTEIVIGARRKELGNMPIQRIISNTITSFLLTLKVRRKILDSQSGYRGYQVKILENILPENRGFMAETEILINACRAGYTIGYITIPTIYGDQVSKMNPVGAILDFLRLLFTK